MIVRIAISKCIQAIYAKTVVFVTVRTNTPIWPMTIPKRLATLPLSWITYSGVTKEMRPTALVGP